MSGSGISWAICKPAPRSRQTATPTPHHSFFTGRMPFLPPNQQRQSTGYWQKKHLACKNTHPVILKCSVSEQMEGENWGETGSPRFSWKITISMKKEDQRHFMLTAPALGSHLAHPGSAEKLPLVWRRKINVILCSQHPALGSHLAHPGSAEKLPSVWRRKINVILCSQHPAVGSNLPLPVKPAEAALIAN